MYSFPLKIFYIYMRCMCAPNFFFFFFLVRNSLFIVYNLFILMQHSILPNSLVEFWTGIDKCFCIEYTVEWKTKSEKNWKKCIKFRCSLHWKKLTISASHVSRKAHTHIHIPNTTCVRALGWKALGLQCLKSMLRLT